jgi:hypothetical protein
LSALSDIQLEEKSLKFPLSMHKSVAARQCRFFKKKKRNLQVAITYLLGQFSLQSFAADLEPSPLYVCILGPL